MKEKFEHYRPAPRALRERGRSVVPADRLAALFLLAVVLFNPFMIRVFDRGAEVGILGVPLLFLYLFVGWGIVIGLAALVIERSSGRLGRAGTDQRRPFSRL